METGRRYFLPNTAALRHQADVRLEHEAYQIGQEFNRSIKLLCIYSVIPSLASSLHSKQGRELDLLSSHACGLQPCNASQQYGIEHHTFVSYLLLLIMAANVLSLGESFQYQGSMDKGPYPLLEENGYFSYARR